MEAAAYEMRRTHLTILISDSKTNISTGSVAKAIQDELGFPWADIHISATFPDDFLVGFKEPWQCNKAYERRSIPLRRGSMVFKSWSLTARGRPETWRFYCRVAMESAPLNAWDDWDTVRSILGGACELDHIERRSVSRDNTAVLFAWVWTMDPDNIPLVKSHSILGRLPARRTGLPEGAPSDEGIDNTRFRILTHLDIIKNYHPILDGDSRRRRDIKFPAVFRKEWQWGEPNGSALPRVRTARNRLGPSNHHNLEDDEEDRRHDRSGGGEGCRRGFRGSGHGDDGRDVRNNGASHRCDNGWQQQRHDWRSSRSPDRRRHGKDVAHEGSRWRSKSPRRDTRGLEQDDNTRAIRTTVVPLLALAAEDKQLRDTEQSRRGRSCTPTSSSAMGLTPSPPSGQPHSPGSPMQLSPPPNLHPTLVLGSTCMLYSPGNGLLPAAGESTQPPSSPPIPWELMLAAGPAVPLANAYADSWSANIVNDEGEGNSRQPLNQQPMLPIDAWSSVFGEHSAEHVPTPQAIQAWNGEWQNGPEAPFDWDAAAAEAGIQQG